MDTIALDLVTDRVVLPRAVLPDVPLEQALRRRCSTRSFAPEPLSPAILSALLWAACGINRPDSGGRTAPSAQDWREFDLFVVLHEGAYRYDAADHTLELVKAEDLRAATGTQDFVAGAPLNLVYVADYSRMTEANPEEHVFFAGTDAACIAQNVSLYCAAAGLATVVRALIDRRRLATALGLLPHQHIALAQTVGRPTAASGS